jgi:putative heme-binding domain-containing protein
MEKMVRLERSQRRRLRFKIILAFLVFLLPGAVPSHSFAQKPSNEVGKKNTKARAASTQNQSKQRTETPTKTTSQPNSQAASRGKTDREPIWAESNGKPNADGYFRRTMELPRIEKAQIEFRSAEYCEVYLNGLRLAMGRKPGNLERIDVSAAVKPGTNILAIRATNRSSNAPFLEVGFFFKPVDAKWRIVVSDSEWKATTDARANWQMPGFDDSEWLEAISANDEIAPPSVASLGAASLGVGSLGDDAPPADMESDSTATKEPFSDSSSTPSGKIKATPVKVSLADYDASKGAPPRERFTTKPGFVVKEVFSSKDVGSVLALAFNEFGHIIASQEGGPLLLLYDSKKNGKLDTVRTYCELVKNVQGILPLNGDVYVTGDGEEGAGLYRLEDRDRNGQIEKATVLLKFKGTPGEHGPHQIAFGPDGNLYIVVGNHSQLDQPWSDDYTFPKPYEGDLVQPRQEDPGGHAVDVKAPGGTIVRYELGADKATVIAGGLRNAYDLAFHPDGSLYVHDSDMEADQGSMWHRRTSLFRIVEGGEYGWRSGWANWPEYYIDRLPALTTSGRGSPTGMVFYNHFMYPSSYQRNLFLADWSEGRIISCTFDPNGKSQPKLEDFVVGTPMNVTDIEVGADGWLYFATGGRGTDGGIYRVEWTGDVPDKTKQLGSGITKAIRLPQLSSAFGRQAAALAKKELGSEWGELVAGVAYSNENPAKYRLQALDLMQLLGPTPTPDILIELSHTTNEAVRTKCARLMGLHAETEIAERLVKLLEDASPVVRKTACESMLRIGVVCDPAALLKLLQSDDREERFLARRVLAMIPEDSWKDEYLESPSSRLVIQSALTLITQSPDRSNAVLVLDSLARLTKNFVSDADFVDLLRVAQVTMHLVTPDAEETQAWSSLVSAEFPAGNSVINAELIRIAAYLKCDLVPEVLKYLQTDTSMPERVLIAMHLPQMPHDWTSKERMASLQFLESAQKERGGGSYHLYVMNTSNALSDLLTEEESIRILSLGEEYPNAALAALMKLPDELDAATVQNLIKLDSAIDRGGLEADVFKRLKTGITAILSGQSDPEAGEYLRSRWRKSPDRRAAIALAFAQNPQEENWDYLVRSLGIIEPFAVPDVCMALRKIDVATEDAEAIRQAILQGCRLVDNGMSPAPAIQLLEYWTGEKMRDSTDPKATPMSAWQRWYEVRYPDSQPAVLPQETERPRWSIEFLEQFLDGEQGKFGSRENGARVFAAAQCASCHKMETLGSGFGPDLTSVARRFTRTEFLESTMFPSHVISDQYASKKVLTTNGQTYTGILVKTPGGVAVRINQEKEVQIREDEIEEILPSRVSAMPSGLLDNLTPTEIRDLLSFMGYVPQEQIAEQRSPAVRR